MAINTLEFSKLFMQALDREILEKSTSGWMEDNAGQVIYHGGDEVKIPILTTDGAGDYDRDNGFVQGSVTLKYQTKVMTQDRGRTFQLDAMDVDESNFIANASNTVSEFQRMHMIPEIDAYRYSSIAAQAMAKNRNTVYTPQPDDILSKLMEDITTIRDVAGADTELIVTMPITVQNILSSSKEISKWIDVGSFSQGSIHRKVKTIDGNTIIAVPSTRMKTAYTFYDGKTAGQEAGGFVTAENAQDINWIICMRNVPIAISKTDVTRVFDPMTNQKANAWKIDYRKYHDLWILDNAMSGLWVNVKPKA